MWLWILKIFRDKESIEILKILDLITNIEEEFHKICNHSEENISQEIRLKDIFGTKVFFIWRNKSKWIDK